MPFKSLAGLKKMGSLDAEVVALAPYQPANVCAAFTNDPAKVAVFPFGAGQSKVQNVSLDVLNDGVLIDERVAVVKSGDELWALLDIQHKPKIDPISRAIRALYDNPGGSTALAVGWDGEGAELKIQGSEVGGRQFAIRGNLRAVSMDGTNCYVVADGDGGGKFREHAGSTPESGTQIRCDLPVAAKKMDRLAGGSQVSALCRRGGSEVCVIRKVGAAALEPKIITLDGNVADVAVIETSVFVATSDGKIKVYGADVLHAASDGSNPPPTFELDLRADGAPTRMAATTRGGNRLWVGTKEGEVLRCDAVKGSMSL
jgi:hypothetical protein